MGPAMGAGGNEPGIKVADDLRARLALDDLVLAVSATLVRAGTGELDAAVTEALRRLAEFMAADRALVFQFSTDGHRLSVTHEHRATGVVSLFEALQDAAVADFEWGAEHLRGGQPVEAGAPDSLVPEAASEAAAMRAHGVKGRLTLPLRIGGDVIGGVAIHWTRGPGRWSPDALTLLQVTAEIIAGVLMRLRAERDLRQTEGRLRSFIASTGEAVACFEVDDGISISLTADEQFAILWDKGRLVDCNEVYARMLGADRPADVFGRTLAESLATPIDNMRALYAAFAANGHHIEGAEAQISIPGGGPRDVVANARGLVHDGRLERTWVIVQDVTLLKQAAAEKTALESQLRQMQKMESIGILAGGVAHDFNNLLFVISNYTQMARTELGRSPTKVDTALGQVLIAAQRATDLTRRLLLFSRRQALERRPLDANEVVRGLLTMLRRLIREAVDIDFIAGHELGTVNGDAGQIEQLLVNLCVNASEAIADIGRITIETENIKINGAYVKAHPWARPGRYVLLTVSDTGTGMASDVRERIFEPFFTTKEPGKGTGLGLSMVYGIVQQHDGMINVYSEVGRGTTFKIYFPIVERAASTIGGKVEGPVRGGTETILVAEDHEMVREVVRRMLVDAGYTVILARDGGEALTLFGQHAAEIGLVLLDAVMPVVSGHSVFEHIARRDPGLPILVASGYTSGVFPTDLFTQIGHELITKPYDADVLLRKIRQALDRARK